MYPAHCLDFANIDAFEVDTNNNVKTRIQDMTMPVGDIEQHLNVVILATIHVRATRGASAHCILLFLYMLECNF